MREALMRVSPISYFWICCGATSTISANFSRLTSLIWRSNLSRLPTCLSTAVGLRGDTPRRPLRTRRAAPAGPGAPRSGLHMPPTPPPSKPILRTSSPRAPPPHPPQPGLCPPADDVPTLPPWHAASHGGRLRARQAAASHLVGSCSLLWISNLS